MATIRRFGPFRLEGEILFRDGEPVPLGQRAVALLHVLVERHGAPVSKDALLEAAWPGLAVEESNLSVQIAALRRVLGEAGGAGWIETMPRRGYRFVGPVTMADEPDIAPALTGLVAEPAPAGAERAAIAVLPFANMTDDPEQEHFADGISEDIITGLSKLNWLPVIARNSSFVYKGGPVSIKQVGVELGARYVLEGSVRKAGERVRITGQLVEADTGIHLWAERYDRELNDLFAVQDEITRQVVGAIDEVVRTTRSRRAPGEPAAAKAVAHRSSERRQLTVMSCELIRAIAGSGDSDLENLREAIGAYRRCVADTVGRFNGVLGDNVGNAMIVYFGYPAVREDDAEQAVRAGLELCAAVANLDCAGNAALSCRVGISTGPVIVDNCAEEEAGGERPERKLIGEVPNVAVQLQTFGQPGAVAIDPSTKRLIGALFDCRSLGRIENRGNGEPLPVSQVLAPSRVESRLEALRGPALTRLVGREEELDILRRRWRQATRGDGRFVLISGEAGIGKSRLAAALQDELQEELQGDAAACIRYSCLPHQQGSALGPVIWHLESVAGYEGDDPPERKLELLAALLDSAGLPTDDISLVAELLSLPGGSKYPPLELSPQRKKERTLLALLRLFQGLARRQPLLIVFEDLHWLDPTSLELLDILAEQVGRLSLLLVATCRPELEPSWIEQPQVTLMTLNRLGHDDSVAIVRQFAEATRILSGRITDEIAERADGVPLFVEELTKAVLEARTDREIQANGPPPIPATLQTSLISRLDRLAPAAKEVAQVGAAIGREFAFDLLAATTKLCEPLLRDGLAQLVEAGLVFQRGTPPHASFLFKHALVQDIIYGTLPRDMRQDLHGRIAAVVEERLPERVAAEPELLAHHFTKAAMPDKAATYCLRAGQLAMRHSAVAEAVAHFNRGLELLGDAPPGAQRAQQQFDLMLALADAQAVSKGYGSREVAEVCARMRPLCQELGDPRRTLLTLLGQFACEFVTAGSTVSLRTAEEVLTLSEKTGDSRSRRTGHRLVGMSLYLQGRLSDAMEHLQCSLAGAVSSPSAPAGSGSIRDGDVTGSIFYAMASFQAGFGERGAALRQAAIGRARSGQISDPYTLAFLLCAVCKTHWFCKEETPLRERAHELAAFSAEQGYAWIRSPAIIHIGWTLVEGGHVESGIRIIEEGLESYREAGTSYAMPYNFGLLASAYGKAGRPERGLKCIAEGFAHAERANEWWFSAELHRIRAELRLLLRERDAAEAAYLEARRVAQEQGARFCELRAALGLTRLWCERGKGAEARGLLAPIYGGFTESLDSPELTEAKALLAALA